MEIILVIASLLGGITILWFIYKKFMVRKENRNHPCLSSLDSIAFRYARPDDIDGIVRLDESVFEEHEIIDRNHFFEWYKKNPKIFTCLAEGNKVVGYFSILPLKKETLNKFLIGEICEKSFTSKDILRHDEAVENCNAISFFSIAIALNYRRLFLRFFLKEIARELQNNDGSIKVYVTAAKKEGKALIERFKFRLVQRAECRVDSHDLYVKEVHNIIKEANKIKDHRNYTKSQIESIDKIAS